MSREKKPTRLDIHRAQYHSFGKKTPLLTIGILSEEEARLIALDVMDKMKVVSKTKLPDENDYYESYAKTLGEWGVMCPHPLDRRSYDGSKLFAESADFRWYECKMCNCAVMNPLWTGPTPALVIKKKDNKVTIKKLEPSSGGDGNSAA